MKYGCCPHCGAEVNTRQRRLNGDDECLAGHVYPSRFTVTPEIGKYLTMVRLTLGLAREWLLKNSANGPLTPTEAGRLAARCKRTLEAIPLTRTERGTEPVAAPVEG